MMNLPSVWAGVWIGELGLRHCSHREVVVPCSVLVVALVTSVRTVETLP